VDDNRRGREGHNEKDSDSAGDRLSEILGDTGQSKDFDINKWLSSEENINSLLSGKDKLDNQYQGYDVERLQFDDQGLGRAEKERDKCGSMACVAYWTEKIGVIEVNLKRNTVESKREQIANSNKNSKTKEKELAELKKKDEELKKQYSYTEQTKKDQQGYNDYINRKNNQGISDLKKETEVNGLPANTVIIVRDETGKEIKYNNFDEYYYSKSPEEKAELARLSAINNELGTKLSNAKTSEEKKKLEKELEQNQQAMNAIVYSKMTYNEYYTGKSLVESALSYKDGVLVVDKNKMLGEVEKADSAKGMEVGRIEGGASQQTVQDIRNKYGSSSVSGSDTIPKDDSYTKYSVSDDEIPKIIKEVQTQTQIEKELGIKPKVVESGIKIDGTTTTGLEIDDLLDNNLGRTFKTYDKYDATTKTATSTKSINLNAKSYQTGSSLEGNMKKAINDVVDFESYRLKEFTLNNSMIETKKVEFVINDIPLNQTQINAINNIVKYGQDNGVVVEFIILK
jgi:hypothetical protein